MNTNSNNNYSEVLRKYSQEFYKRNERQLTPILRSNSSLSLDQKRVTNTTPNNSNSIDFKDFQELRECRFGSDLRSMTASTTTTTPKRTTSQSLTSQSLHSISNENLSKAQMKSKSKRKMFFQKSKEKFSSNIDNAVVSMDIFEEEAERKQRLRQMFVHYDIQSSLSCDELFLTTETETTTTPSTSQTTTPDSIDHNSCDDHYYEENEFNSNSLLSFSKNFRNEIGKELVFNLLLNCDEKREERSRRERQPIHSTTLSRQLSCLSSYDWNESQTLLLSSPSQAFCPYNRDFDFNSNVLEMDFGINYYRKYFYGFSHQNWFQNIGNKTIIALSFRKDLKDLQKLRIILRTNHSLKALKGFLRLKEDEKHMNLKEIFELLFPKKWTKNCDFINGFRLGFDSKSDELLLKFDELLVNNCYKIGILYSKSKQQTEEEFYNNNNIYDSDFEEFLSIIGTKIRLKDYKGFKAGLDVMTDTTGLYSYSTRFQFNSQLFDIMYHVMTELPFTPNNTQQLLRKRHIGNDIVTIVFQSKDFSGKPFNPEIIRSHFQHIFIIIRPFRNGYRVAITRHKAVPPFGPPLKPFYTKSELRQFLLTKIINAENHCHKVNKFKQMALRTRFEYLNDLFMNYSTQTSIHSLMTSQNNTSQQLLQFSTNFNQFFSQIFSKNVEKSKEKRGENNENNKLLIKENNISSDLIFGGKLYEIKELNHKLFIYDFKQSKDLEIKVLLTQKLLIIISLEEKRVIFIIKLESIIGWILSGNQLKVFIHFGELLLIKEVLNCGKNHQILQELKEDLKEIKIINNSLEIHLKSLEMKEILLKRNLKENSFGFHIQKSLQNQQIVVTEVNEWAKSVNQLEKSQRILELCKISVKTLSYEQILDYLKTSQTVMIAIVQPLVDGSVRQIQCRSCSQSIQTKQQNHNFNKSLENISLKANNCGDYENIAVVVNNNNSVKNNTMTTTTTTAPIKTITTAIHNNNNSRQHITTTPNHRQRQHNTITTYNNQNNNHSSQSSTTSSTFQEDLIKLITLNDCDINEDNQTTRAVENDSHSSSRYSTATSTPYSSLERRRDDDCVVTVAKPAFVVNVVNNEFNTNNSEVNNSDDNDIEWPSLVATATRVLNENDFQLKEKVKELSKEKFILNETIKQLKEENQRLHLESQTASQQLRKFTEWFFNSNNNNN